MLLTLVDPNQGFERAYNRWYERDHYYAGCLIGPWLFAGSRWVAPRTLKDRRWPADEPIARPGRRRLLRGHLLGGAGPPRRPLRGVGRPPGPRAVRRRPGLPERTHVHTVLFNHLGHVTATTTRSRSSWPWTTPTTAWSSCGGTPDRARPRSSTDAWRPTTSRRCCRVRPSRWRRPGSRRSPTRAPVTSPWSSDHRRGARPAGPAPVRRGRRRGLARPGRAYTDGVESAGTGRPPAGRPVLPHGGRHRHLRRPAVSRPSVVGQTREPGRTGRRDRPRRPPAAASRGRPVHRTLPRPAAGADVAASRPPGTRRALGLEPFVEDLSVGYVALRHRPSRVVIVLTARPDAVDPDGTGRGPLDHRGLRRARRRRPGRWADHLTAIGLVHGGIVLEDGRPSLQLRDPDGTAIELVAPAPRSAPG